MADNKYFASKSNKECAEILLAKVGDWNNVLEENQYLEKVRRSWAAYYGASMMDVGGGHKITFAGEQEEIVRLPVNHFRNIAAHIIEMATSSRPAFEARSINTDYKSLAQTFVANGIMDYYLREKGLEDLFKKAVEYAVVLGSGYIKLAWDAFAGEVYDVDDDGNPLYEGDVVATLLSPFDVVMDGSKESSHDNDWILVRSYKNKYDLIAKYPEFEQEILNLKTKTDEEDFRFVSALYDKTDDVSVFEFYHKRTESLPNGRYMIFCNENAVFMDTDLPYRMLPIFRIAPSEIMGTPYGYTSMFDLLPLQEGINSLYTALMTNNNAFAIQSIISPRGNDVSLQQMGPMNFIEYNAQFGKPEALQLTQSAPETYEFLDKLVKDMETLSGVNSVTRGNPEASLKSGTSLAMVQSMAIQFISGLQNSYVRLCENVGTGLIKMLQDFAITKRSVTLIAGKTKRSYVKEFSNDSISNIARVTVSISNALSRTTAGRVEIARDLLQMGAIKTPQEYLMVMDTGQIDSMYEGDNKELMNIRQENERMMDKVHVPVLFVDDHRIHIMEHKSLLADPDMRQDGELVNLVGQHIMEHYNMLRDTDPNMLAVLGQQPLNPPMAPPGAPPQGGGAPQGGGPEQYTTPDGQDQIQMQTPDGMDTQSLPNLPSPPAGFEHLPTDPSQLPPL